MEMANNPEQTNKVFSMKIDDLYDFLSENKSLLTIGKQLVSYHIKDGGDHLVGNLGEVCSLASKICLIIQAILDATDEQDEVAYVYAKDMLMLQSLLSLLILPLTRQAMMLHLLLKLLAQLVLKVFFPQRLQARQLLVLTLIPHLVVKSQQSVLVLTQFSMLLPQTQIASKKSLILSTLLMLLTIQHLLAM